MEPGDHVACSWGQGPYFTNNVYEVEQMLCKAAAAADGRLCEQHGCEDHGSKLCLVQPVVMLHLTPTHECSVTLNSRKQLQTVNETGTVCKQEPYTGRKRMQCGLAGWQQCAAVPDSSRQWHKTPLVIYTRQQWAAAKSKSGQQQKATIGSNKRHWAAAKGNNGQQKATMGSKKLHWAAPEVWRCMLSLLVVKGSLGYVSAGPYSRPASARV